MEFVIMRHTCQRHRPYHIGIEFLDDQDRSFKIIMLPISFNPNIETERAPPYLSFIEIELGIDFLLIE